MTMPAASQPAVAQWSEAVGILFKFHSSHFYFSSKIFKSFIELELELVLKFELIMWISIEN